MKKYILIIAALVFSNLVFAQQKGVVTIKGTLSGDLKGANKIYLYTRTTNDSAAIVDGHYTFSFPFESVGLKFLYPEYIKMKRMMYQPYGILISEPGIYYVTSDINKGMQASELKGPKSLILYHQYAEEEKTAYSKLNVELAKMYGKDWYQIDEKSPLYDKFQKSSDSLKDEFILPGIRKIISENPDSYASAYILSGSGKSVGSLKEKESLYNLLSDKIKNSSAGKQFWDYIEGLKNSVIGRPVIEFTLPDADNKPIDFKNLAGKYILIDFWASWCAPCRQSFPHMREIYKKYHSDKFEIYSISIDESKAAWLKAVKEENNPWLQSLDTKNISQRGFAVTGVPSTFLIDPNGVIVAKEVGFDPDGNSEIEKKIKELFPSNKKNTTSVPMAGLN
jgi:thiol-disulfide isomerase/thioredoxin